MNIDLSVLIPVLQDIFSLCIIPLLGIIVKYLVSYLNTKKEATNQTIDSEIALKYNSMIYDTIISCIIATNQTYVESLKEQGKFDKEAQKIAFSKTYNAVISLLSSEAQKYIKETYGDLQLYLTEKIEAEVARHK